MLMGILSDEIFFSCLGILDEDVDDILVNYNIIDDEKAERNVTNKKKLPDYNPYDEPTIDEFGMVGTKNN